MKHHPHFKLLNHIQLTFPLPLTNLFYKLNLLRRNSVITDITNKVLRHRVEIGERLRVHLEVKSEWLHKGERQNMLKELQFNDVNMRSRFSSAFSTRLRNIICLVSVNFFFTKLFFWQDKVYGEIGQVTVPRIRLWRWSVCKSLKD